MSVGFNLILEIIDEIMLIYVGVEPFLGKNVSETALRMLIRESDIVEIKTGTNTDTYIYKEGDVCDFFALILEGM